MGPVVAIAALMNRIHDKAGLHYCNCSHIHIKMSNVIRARSGLRSPGSHGHAHALADPLAAGVRSAQRAAFGLWICALAWRDKSTILYSPGRSSSASRGDSGKATGAPDPDTPPTQRNCKIHDKMEDSEVEEKRSYDS